MNMGWFGRFFAGSAAVLAWSVAGAAVSASEVANLPADAAYGGGDKVGSQLIAATYNAGGGPGIWIVADGGYRLYVNGEMLAEDNQAGRVRFVPYTFLPGENAVSVVGVNGSGAPGVMVQIDELDRSYYSGGDWKSKPVVGDNSWKNKGRNLSQWGGATTLNYANTALPSGGALKGFAPNTLAKWIWTASEDDKTAVLLFTFNIKAEGFGANTTGGDGGEIVVASDAASIKKYMSSEGKMTIVVPEGTYDFRNMVNAATDAANRGWTWCKSSCGAGDKNSSNTFYRISFTENSCSGLSEQTTMVSISENLMSSDTWTTTRANKSLVGMGRGANLRGASFDARSYEGGNNNIFRNLAVYDKNPHLIEAGDGISVDGDPAKGSYVSRIWVDHVSYKWISDGMDLGGLKEATVSYLDYDGANEYNCYYYDPYMHLIQDAEVTFANVYWHNTYGRVPKVASDYTDSKVHIYNSYVDYNYWHIIDATGNSSHGSQVLYENNYIGEANWRVAGKDAYSKINIRNTTIVKTNQKTPYDEANGSTATAPTDNVFTPGYSFEKRSVANLPTELPKVTGVGGRFGKMPAYDQAFGMSKKAAEVKLSAPAANAKYDAGAGVVLSAVKSAGDGSVKNVDFYIGNDNVGSAASAPYSVTVSGLSAGVYSAVAVVTDNNGLTHMSEFVTFEVAGEVYPEVVKCGAGSSSQAVVLGEPVADFCYTWTGAETVKAEGFPDGVTANVDNAAKKISISGTPVEVGEFSFKVSATNGDSTFVKTGKIVVKDSSSGDEGLSAVIANPLQLSTEAVSGFYRAFDLQGRPLYAGDKKPGKLKVARAIVVEYARDGSKIRSYLQVR